MKILLGDINAEVCKEDIFKPTTTGNESLHEISNDSEVRVGNFATSQNLSKLQCSHIITFINIIWTSPNGKTIKLTISDRRQHSYVLDI
jgi:hypothetical protein